jgi:hypothetical protein
MSTRSSSPSLSESSHGDGGRLSRLTRRSAVAASRRPWTVIALWLVLVVGLLVAGGMTGTRMLSDNDGLVGDSAAANSRLVEAGLSDPTVENLMVSTDDPASARAAVSDLMASLRSEVDVKAVSDPFGPGGAVSDDGSWHGPKRSSVTARKQPNLSGRPVPRQPK